MTPFLLFAFAAPPTVSAPAVPAAITAPAPKSAVLSAAPWPEFRGTDGVGHYTGAAVVTEWGPDKNVVWKTPVAGLGWSSPVLVKGLLVMTTAVPKGAEYSLRAVALDAATGTQKWDVELFVENAKDVPQPHKKNSHASPTPVTDGENVYVHFGHMGTAALDLKGSVLWSTQELKYKPVHGNGGSPILHDGKLLFCCDGGDVQLVAALSAKSGSVVWKVNRGWKSTMPFSFATSQIIDVGGKKQLVSPGSDNVAAYDPENGTELWRVKYPAAGWSLISRPVVAAGLVIIQTGYINQHILAIDPSGTGDVTATHVKWKNKKQAPNTPTPLAVGDELYVLADSGFFTCFDAKTGEMHYSERLAGRGYSASPLLINGQIFVTSEEGVGQVLATGKAFKELARSDMKERTFATFVPNEGALFVRTESAVYRFGKK